MQQKQSIEATPNAVKHRKYRGKTAAKKSGGAVAGGPAAKKAVTPAARPVMPAAEVSGSPEAAVPTKAPAEKKSETENKGNAAKTSKETNKDAGKQQNRKDRNPAEQPAEKQKTVMPAAPAKAPQPAQTKEPEPPVEDEKRIADLTRTVQLSIEQVMAGLNEQDTTPPRSEPNAEADIAEEEPPLTLGRRVRNALTDGALHTLKWLGLVLFFVVLIGAAGVAWLYQGATEGAIPDVTVTFGGQQLQATAYHWEVPVIGNDFKRTYAETVSPTAVKLAEPVEQASPDLSITPSGYSTKLTVYDDKQEVLFDGNPSQFGNYVFPTNGNYSAKLVLDSGDSAPGGAAAVTGTQTYQFAFEVNIRPSVRLSTQSITQGSVLAIRVSGLVGNEPPTLSSIYQDTGFARGTSDWICYLPIPYDAEVGPSELTVSAGGYTDKIGLTIRARNWDYKDYGSTSRLTSPYIGVDDAPAEVKALLNTADPQIYWTDSGFVQPFVSSVSVKLAFGVTEFVGRTTTQKTYNTGSGRTALNCVITTVYGDPLIAPCGGLVLLAEDLGGTAGKTLVIEHGAGLKSIFYGLMDLTVSEGDYVVQGQTVGRTGRTVIAEMRIGTVPVEPFSIWRGQCDAIKIF